jgi:uncharacterized membrane protein
MRDALAVIAAVIWFALNIVLWVMRLPDLLQFVCSLALGVVFFAGFFGYLAYREGSRSNRPVGF